MSKKKQPKRWSAKRREEEVVVLRLLRVESLDALSRETGLGIVRLAGRVPRRRCGRAETPHRRSEDGRAGARTQTRQATGQGPDDGQGATGDAHCTFRGRALSTLAQGGAADLVLQHDHRPQYMSYHFQPEIAFLGIEASPGFVRAPEGNGVAARFIRTLKQQLLWVQTLDTVEELRQALLEFKERFIRHWLLQRHGYYATPAKVRAAHASLSEAA